MTEDGSGPGLRLPSLRIENFRCFKELVIPKLGRVNLIVGRNGVGKTTLLEALRIYFSEAPLTAIGEILTKREHVIAIEASPQMRGDFQRKLLSLFHGRPTKDKPIPTIVIGDAVAPIPETSDSKLFITFYSKSDSKVRMSMYIRSKKPELMKDFDSSSFYVLSGDGSITESNLPINQQELSRFLPELRSEEERAFNPTPADNVSYISSDGVGKDRNVALWDEITATDDEYVVVEAVQNISADISEIRLRMVPGQSDVRDFVVRLSKFSSQVPLASLGEGVGRLFGIALVLVNSRNRAVLIDEIENGIHWSAQPKLWEVVFSLAERLNVQVFATTHSEDCVRGFQEAMTRHPGQGMMTRLEWDGTDIRPVSFDDEELALFTQRGYEVR
jgi:hypothetical protein